MSARRVAYVVSVLILILAVGSALARREEQRTRAVAPAATAPSDAPAPEASAAMPPDRVVRARVGEIVSVQVRTPGPDTATIRDAGISAITSDDLPGTLEFVPTEPGRYPVLLEDSGRVAGTILVSSDR